MILVRDIFQLKFGKAREAKNIWKDGAQMRKKLGYGPSRALTDLTGQYYTFVMETTFDSLTAYDKGLGDTLSAQEFGDWYQKFVPLIESGRREIFTIVE